MITKWLSSYRTYSLAVVYTHILIFAFFFPYVIIYTFATVCIFVFFYVWCELNYQIETTNRLQLVRMIKETDNEVTKDILRYELYLHDKHSMSRGEYDMMGNHYGI